MKKKNWKYILIFSSALSFLGAVSLYADYPFSPFPPSVENVGGWLGYIFNAEESSNTKLVLDGDLEIRGVTSCSGKLYTDSSGEVQCGTDRDTNTTYSAGNGISLSGTQFSVTAGNGLSQTTTGLQTNAQACSSGYYSYWTGSSWSCRLDSAGDNLGNHSATRDLDMNSRSITEVLNLTAGSISSSWIEAENRILSEGPVLSYQYMVAPKYYSGISAPNTFYYLDPQQLSKINSLTASSVTAAGFFGNKYYDNDNSSYYVDPYSTSRLNTLYATSFIYSSDKTLKKDVQKIESALEKVTALEGVKFKWKETEEEDLGLIAQEVEDVFPELVEMDQETGLKAVKYGNLVAPLIEAIKEQQVQIEELKAEINQLKTQ